MIIKIKGIKTERHKQDHVHPLLLKHLLVRHNFTCD